LMKNLDGNSLMGGFAMATLLAAETWHMQANLQPACLQVCMLVMQSQALHDCQRGCDNASAIQLALPLAIFPLQELPFCQRGFGKETPGRQRQSSPAGACLCKIFHALRPGSNNCVKILPSSSLSACKYI
jgi:hypothetical protein